MVTSHKIFKGDSYYIEHKGLKNDPKPANLHENDIFIELDTDSTFKVINGKWKRIFDYNEGGGGTADLNIDIIGSDKKLSDLDAIAVGYNLPDIPPGEDIVLEFSVEEEEGPDV